MTMLNTSGELIKPTPAELAEADETGEIYILLTGTAVDGRPYWLYAGIFPSQYSAFMEANATGKELNMDLYGRIIRFGYDAEVPADMREEMQRDYGMDAGYEEKLAAEIKEERAVFTKKKEDNKINGIVAMLKQKQSQ